jgi:mono/diheme cytochrome c family protein
MRHLWLAFLFVAYGTLLLATTDGSWLTRVPEAQRIRPNPFASDPNAAEAGAILYERNCASCHGESALGRRSHPSLRSTRVHNATDGELFWLLTNGNLRNGMPSWSRLPEAQRWQLVRYLHSIPLGTTDSSQNR